MNDRITVAYMAAIRAAAGLTEIVAAMVILRLGTVHKALQINAMLAVVGPIFMLIVTGIGLIGLAGRMPPAKVALIAIGAGLILAGSK